MSLKSKYWIPQTDSMTCSEENREPQMNPSVNHQRTRRELFLQCSLIHLSRVRCYLIGSPRWSVINLTSPKPDDFDLWLVRGLAEVTRCPQWNWEGWWWSTRRASLQMRRDIWFHQDKGKEKSDCWRAWHSTWCHQHIQQTTAYLQRHVSMVTKCCYIDDRIKSSYNWWVMLAGVRHQKIPNIVR